MWQKKFGGSANLDFSVGSINLFFFFVGRRRYDSSESEDEELQEAIRASLRETHMDRPPSLDDNDPGIQSAIRESLDDVGGEPSRWSNDPRVKSRGQAPVQQRTYPLEDDGMYYYPRSGATSQPPPYPLHDENLYPRVPNNRLDGGTLHSLHPILHKGKGCIPEYQNLQLPQQNILPMDTQEEHYHIPVKVKGLILTTWMKFEEEGLNGLRDKHCNSTFCCAVSNQSTAKCLSLE